MPLPDSPPAEVQGTRPPETGVVGGKITKGEKGWVEEVPEEKGGGLILWREENGKWLPYDHVPAGFKNWQPYEDKVPEKPKKGLEV